MDITQTSIDILRAAHLVCFAAGMGTALYFDFRTFKTLHEPIDVIEIQSLERIHVWISSAFACMWVTGGALIYIRTSFDLNAFSPKLWTKIGIMVLMIWNAYRIGKVVIPMLHANIGRPLIELPKLQLMRATQLAANSMFCWTAGLMLGSSAVLKVAPWSVLLPATAVWFVLLTLGGHLTVVFMRMKTPLPAKLTDAS